MRSYGSVVIEAGCRKVFISDQCHWHLEHHRNFLRRRGWSSFLSLGVQTRGVAGSPPQTQSLGA